MARKKKHPDEVTTNKCPRCLKVVGIGAHTCKPYTQAGEDYMAKAKKTRVSGVETVLRGNWSEAEASCSLDGCTQSCPACVQKVEHVCGKRAMTAAERELVEAALAWYSDRKDWKLEEVLMITLKNKCLEVSAERKEAAK